MKNTLSFNLKSFLLFLTLFWIEVLIAFFAHDAFIRPIFGDFLAVMVVYYFLKSFLKINTKTLIGGSLFFAYFIEILQYFNFLALVGWQKHRIIAIVLGSSFSWGDILAYTLGAFFLFLLEKKRIGLTFGLTRKTRECGKTLKTIKCHS